MEQAQLIEAVKQLVEPILKGRQVELVELTCRYEGRRLALRFLVDTARGVTVDELAGLNQAISAVLDEHELIGDRYVLEVNSPGLDRSLKNGPDFERVIGRRLRVETTVAVNSRFSRVGELVNANDEAIVLKLDSGEKERILLSLISRAVQEVEL